jgi:hypothetical protein
MKALMTAAMVVAMAASAMAGVQVFEDWADTTDHWGDAMFIEGTEVLVGGGVAQMVNSGSNNFHSGAARLEYTPAVPDASYWWDLGGNAYDRFTLTLKNTAATAKTWGGTGDNSYIGINFKRYSSAADLNPNTVRWNFDDLIVDATGDGVVDPDETITLTGMFDAWDFRSRTEMYGWDLVNDRLLVSGWWLRKDYNSSGANSPYELGIIYFTTAPPPPQPVAEPAALGIVGIGLIAVRRKRS